MNPNKNAKKKEATSAPEAHPQDPQTSNVKTGIKVPPKVSYCYNCRRNTESDLSVPYCDRNPLGLAGVTAEQHGNIIGGMVTCDDGYCDPQERTLEEFYELADKDAVPQETFARCQACQHLKQPDSEDSKPASLGSPSRKMR